MELQEQETTLKELKCSRVVGHVPEGSVDRWYRDGHCARRLKLPHFPSGHIVVSSFVCALSDLRLIRVTASMAQVKNNNQSIIHHSLTHSLTLSLSLSLLLSVTCSNSLTLPLSVFAFPRSSVVHSLFRNMCANVHSEAEEDISTYKNAVRMVKHIIQGLTQYYKGIGAKSAIAKRGYFSGLMSACH